LTESERDDVLATVALLLIGLLAIVWCVFQLGLEVVEEL
jgi:hypothetical protein